MRFIKQWNDVTWLMVLAMIWCVYVLAAWSILPIIFPETHRLVFVQLAVFPVLLLVRLWTVRLERRIDAVAPEVVASQVVDLSGIERRLDAIEQRIGKLRAAPSRKRRQPRVKLLSRTAAGGAVTRLLRPD